MKLTKTNKKIKLLEFEFSIYSIDDLNNDNDVIENLPDGSGLYCFTKKECKTSLVTKDEKSYYDYSHRLLYLGMSSDFLKRPTYHEKLKELRDCQMDSLSILQLDNNVEDIKEKESLILSEYFFVLNKQENYDKENKKTIVMEV